MTSVRSLISYFLFLISFALPYRDFLYILQSEDYRTDRFLRWLPQFYFRRHIEKRATLVWTRRAQCVALLAATLQLGLFILIRMRVLTPDGNLLINVLVALVLCLLAPLFILLAHTLTAPLFTLLHRRAWTAAAARLARMGDTKVVLVVGSFGKTTARAYIEAMLHHNYTLATPPGNINTETGVAQWVAKQMPASTTLLLLEADAYAEGDIARMCSIAQPHIAVITALGDQHLERLGSRETLVRATQEAFAHAHDTATLVARSDVWDELTGAQYTYPGKYKVNADHVHADYAECEDALLALSHTQRSAALLALAVAHTLLIPARFAISALSETHAPHRRQELKKIHAGGASYDGLDDSYNISLTTALAALRHAQGEAERLRKKLVVVVAGIPEAVDGGADNTKLALACLEGAAHTVAVESVFTPHFRAVFAREHDKLTVLPSVRNSVLLELPTRFNPDEWFVLLFNELGDLYH